VRADDPADLPIPDMNAPATDLKPGGSSYQELLQRYDTNHDGKLDDDELAAAHEDMARERLENGQGVGKKVRQQLLEKFDKNHDGRLEPDEREAARQYLQQHVELRQQFLLERYDKNGDGKLDDTERAAMKADFAKMRGQRSTGQGDATPPANNNGASGNAPPAP
jgi:hypothetical protein